MKKHKQTLRIASALMALALMAVLAGCGGGGGGAASSSATAPSYGRVGMAVDFGSSVPARLAAIESHSEGSYLDDGILYQGCGDFSVWHDAAYQTTTSDTEIPVHVYVTEDAQSLSNSPYAYTESQTGEYYGPIASACTTATRDVSTQRVTFRSSGSFEIKNVLEGTNHLLEAKAFTGDSYGIYVAVVVPYVAEGFYTTGVVASPETTLAAAAAIKYAYTSQLALSEVDDADIAAINDAVDTLFPSGFQYGVAVTPTGLSSVTFTDYASFNMTYATGTTSWVDYVLEEAGLATGTTPVTPTVPTVVTFSPAAGATNVDYDATPFSVTFSESMDTTVTPTGFAVTIQNNSTGGTITIDSSNVLSYGSFSWTTTTVTNDTLVYTLNSTSVLGTAGLKYLQPGTTYTITSVTLPTNVVSTQGVAPDLTGTTTTGSFTTAAGSAPTVYPYVVAFTPASGDTGVDPVTTAFSAKFSESMDPTVTSPAGFSISIQNVNTGGTLTIDDTNASLYGSFSWTTTSLTNDTLVFTLFTSAVLTGNGVTGLDYGTDYYITSWTPPSNIVSAGALPVDSGSLPSTGMFSTMGI
jgi:hypothetical protein